jgi:hypothetical protein
LCSASRNSSTIGGVGAPSEDIDDSKLFAATARAQEVFIERAPPPLRHEVIPALPPERAAREVWRSGAWHWNGREYVWEAGH